MSVHFDIKSAARPGSASRGRSDWSVATLRCYELGLELRGAPQPEAAPWLSPDRRAATLGELLAAAVCHATNWDRLRAAIRRLAADPQRFTASRLAHLRLDEFRESLSEGFAPDEPLAPRHRLFTQTAAAVAEGMLQQLDELQAPARVGGHSGLYEHVRRLPAFGGDPEAKKARILIQELCRTQLLQPSDPHAVRPAIEYHLIRLYLRTQRVGPVRSIDGSRLHRGETFRAPVIMRIRRAVEEAMYYTASAAELSVCDLNLIEWQIARSFCERRGPRCAGPPHPGKPVDRTVTALSTGGRCPFSPVCGSSTGEAGVVKIVEPQLSSRYDYY